MENLNVRAKTIKFFKEIMGVKLYDLGFGNGFLDMIPKIQTPMNRKLDFIKI